MIRDVSGLPALSLVDGNVDACDVAGASGGAVSFDDEHGKSRVNLGVVHRCNDGIEREGGHGGVFGPFVLCFVLCVDLYRVLSLVLIRRKGRYQPRVGESCSLAVDKSWGTRGSR